MEKLKMKHGGAGSVAIFSSSLTDQSTTAEVMWTLKVGSSDVSFASCSDIPLFLFSKNCSLVLSQINSLRAQ